MKSNESIVYAQLPQVISVLNLLSDAVYARICIECGWDDDTYRYYFTHSDRIPAASRQKINKIIAAQIRYLASRPPQIHPHDESVQHN
ncbi:hypothetical protein ACQKLP_17715 [Chitinophaga sp. NPDC101104]|uniref:hypothetical protein n=1 Tax=Chitinophaga sp. NPDC101104 TaxID=3390561 RepID=UPI003D047B3F